MSLETEKNIVLRSAGLMAAGTLLSRIFGLVREQVFAFLFGAGMAVDAFQIAFRIPNLLRDLFAEGAMSSALVPVFTRVRFQQGDRRAWRVAGLVFRVLGVSVSLLAFVGFFLAPLLVELYASSFKKVEGQFELTVRMTRCLFPFFPCVSLAAAFMAILNACGFFFIPAFASALFNIFSILVGTFCSLTWEFLGLSHPIEGMAIGVLGGGLIQALCQLPYLYQTGYRWQKKDFKEDPPWYKDPDLRQMLFLMTPGMLGLAATQVNLLINTLFATSRGSGAVSWLSYAFRLMQFPIGVLGVSLASATLSKASQDWSRRDIKSMVQSLSDVFDHVLISNLMVSAFFIFLGEPIIQLIFEYGKFSFQDTYETAMALKMYAFGLVAYSLLKVLVPLCYVVGKTQVAVLSSFLSIGVSLIFNLWVAPGMGHSGLALGTSVAAFVNVFSLGGILWYELKKEGFSLPLPSMGVQFIKCFLAAWMMGWFCSLSYENGLMKGCFSGEGVLWTVLARSFDLFLIFFEGVALFSLMAYLLKIKGLFEFVNFFLKKLKNKLRV